MLTPGSDLILTAPIEQCEAHRNHAVALLGQVYDLLAEARGHMAKAAPSRPYAAHFSDTLTGKLIRYGSLGDRTEFLDTATEQLDRETWKHLLAISGLERLMDQRAKREFDDQLRTSPPPATADNCRATMQALFADAGTIFQRGVAEAFSTLDRRFKSHDGFKIGARIVLSGAFTEHGMWNHYRECEAAFRDVERAFYLLDGKQQPERAAGIAGEIDRQRPRGLQSNAYQVEDEYFRVRIFKNGNLHVWFKRGDLLQRVNQLLGQYYGAVLGDARQDHTAPTGQAPVAGYSFWPSPSGVANRVLEEASLWQAGLTVLEPSAGTGALAFPAADKGCVVTAIELQEAFAKDLASDGRLARVIPGDFMLADPGVLGRFDRVIMNPPFCGGRDIDHVRHALRFVKPGGRLVAVMSAGIAFKEDAKTVALRSMIESAGGRIMDLPARSFAEVGTNINTCVVTIPVR